MTAIPEGVSLAPFDLWNEPDPVWHAIEDYPGVKVQRIEIDRGREDEQDKVDAGTVTVEGIETLGYLDPTNLTSPLFPDLKPGKQAAFALRNPYTDVVKTRFRGFLDQLDYDIDVSQSHAKFKLTFVDAFGFLSRLEMTPGNHGDPAPAAALGQIYFKGGSTVYASIYKHVNQRVIEALADVGWPPSRQIVFSGNTQIQEATYERQSQVLQVLFDCADCEFPGVAVVFVNRLGSIVFHGRDARFHPERPGYGINFWPAGDGAAVDIDAGRAQITVPLAYRLSTDDIVNSGIAYPEHVDETDVPDQLVEDAGSIADHGRISWSAPDLLTYKGHDTDLSPTTGVEETKRFSEYMVGNKSEARPRIESLTFKPVALGRPHAAAQWELHCGIDISDVIDLKTTHPGGGGFDEPWYVEGIRQTIVPMGDGMHEVTTECEISPRAWFDYNPWGDIGDNDDMNHADPIPVESGSTAGNSVGFSNEDDDPDSATSKDPIVQEFTSLFTGPGGDYGDEAVDTHNFRTAWYQWTVPVGWDAGSSFSVTLSDQTQPSVLLMVLPGISGVPPDNGDYTPLGTGGVANTPASTSDLTQTESGVANVSAGDVIYIGVGSLGTIGEDFALAWTYTP